MSEHQHSDDGEQSTTLNPNSALYWYPRLEAAADLPVSIPETEFVEYDFMESLPLASGEPANELPWDEFVDAAEEIGYPAFLRTDQKSVKHAGPGAYRAEEPDDIPTILAVLTDFHAKSHRHPSALMVREFVEINALFRAFDGLPIGREFRVFATPDEVCCDHFYWPAEAIADGRGTPTTMDREETLSDTEWRDRLDDLSSIESDQRSVFHNASLRAVESLNEPDRIPDDTAWSLDFAQDRDGDWWLIDVAIAEDSWHPDECECSFDGGAPDAA